MASFPAKHRQKKWGEVQVQTMLVVGFLRLQIGLSNWGEGERKTRGIPGASELRGNGRVMVLWLPLQESS